MKVKDNKLRHGQNSYFLPVKMNSLQISTESKDQILVNPDEEVMLGNLVVVHSSSGQILAGIFKNKTKKSMILKSVNPDKGNTILRFQDINKIHRIVARYLDMTKYNR